MTANRRYDAIVIGAGHNGLVCAAYLQRAGFSVAVVEAADRIGGAAANREFHPGFSAPLAAHLLHGLHPGVISELRLARHGFELAAGNLRTTGLSPDGAHFTMSGPGGNHWPAGCSEADTRALPRFLAQTRRFAGALAPFLRRTPPRLGTGAWRDYAGLARLAWAVRRLGRDEMREFLRIAAMNIADLLEETFENDIIKGTLAFDAVLGARLGPRSPNSVFSLLYRLTGETARAQGAIGVPKGGMAGLIDALARAAGDADIRLASPVARILVEHDRAVGVALEGGEELAAPCVVSSADPKRTFLSLLGAEHLDTGFVRRVRNIRMQGVAAKLILALDGLPEFRGLPADAVGQRLVISPGIDYLETAFNACKYGNFSDAPAIEITVPSIHDPSLAPEGKHVLSAIVQYAPYDLERGWESQRDNFARTAIATISNYAPGLADRIIARQVVTPLDLERHLGMTGGHWHHGEIAPDQMFMLRPVPGWAQYRTPLAGLYLCGAGTHPGGGVTGAPGMNAAREIIAAERVARSSRRSA